MSPWGDSGMKKPLKAAADSPHCHPSQAENHRPEHPASRVGVQGQAQPGPGLDPPGALYLESPPPKPTA